MFAAYGSSSDNDYINLLMAKRKKIPEPIEQEMILPKKSVLNRTKDIVKNNPNALWRTFQASLLGLLIFLADNGKDWIKAAIEKQKTQTERQAAWQIKAEARHQALLKNDSIIINLLTKPKTK